MGILDNFQGGVPEQEYRKERSTNDIVITKISEQIEALGQSCLKEPGILNKEEIESMVTMEHIKNWFLAGWVSRVVILTIKNEQTSVNLVHCAEDIEKIMELQILAVKYLDVTTFGHFIIKLTADFGPNPYYEQDLKALISAIKT